jgi:hypothetical protein
MRPAADSTSAETPEGRRNESDVGGVTMRTRTISFALLTVLGPALAACESGSSPFEPEPQFVEIETAADVVIDVAALDRGDGDKSLFDQLAKEIPGFAGFWFDRGCNLNVVLTDRSQAEKAKEILTPYLRRYLETHPDCPRGAGIVVHSGEFSWVELSRWLDALRPAAALRGVSRIGISVQMNRIVVAVDGRETAKKVLEIAERNGVPTAAIKFVLAGGTSRDGDSTRRDGGSTRSRG